MKKSDYYSRAFSTKDGRNLSRTGKPQLVILPKKLEPGTDYEITASKGVFRAKKITAKPSAKAEGGFHVGLDGLINPHSLWDTGFRPKCPDPRGMVFVPYAGWVDVYLLNTEAHIHGTSSAGKEIADGKSQITIPDGTKRPLTWFAAVRVLGVHGKQLLSKEEFTAAMDGVEVGKRNGTDPKVTGHAPGLKSKYGIEQATGCMWTWGRDIWGLCGPWMDLMGGFWDSGAAGPRRFSDDLPDYEWNFVGARGRCDHLFPDRSKAKA